MCRDHLRKSGITAALFLGVVQVAAAFPIESGELGIALVQWHYGERLVGRPSLQSSWRSEGLWLEGRFRARQRMLWGEIAAGIGGTLRDRREHWRFGTSTQQNAMGLEAAELSLRLGVPLGITGVDGFALIREGFEVQRRHRFVLNGVPVFVPNEPIRERVHGRWLGGGLGWHNGRWALEAEWASLWRARAINDLYGRFASRSGQMWRLSASWRSGAWEFLARWQQRTITGGRNPRAIWPWNRLERWMLLFSYVPKSSW